MAIDILSIFLKAVHWEFPMNKWFFPIASKSITKISGTAPPGPGFLLGYRPSSHLTYCRPSRFRLLQSEPSHAKFKEKELGIGVHSFTSCFIDTNPHPPTTDTHTPTQLNGAHVEPRSFEELRHSRSPSATFHQVSGHLLCSGLIANFILLLLFQVLTGARIALPPMIRFLGVSVQVRKQQLPPGPFPALRTHTPQACPDPRSFCEHSGPWPPTAETIISNSSLFRIVG